MFKEIKKWLERKRIEKALKVLSKTPKAVVSDQPPAEVGQQAADYLYSFFCLTGKEPDKNMRKAILTLAISETTDALRTEAGAQEVRGFLTMLARQQHDQTSTDENRWKFDINGRPGADYCEEE